MTPQEELDYQEEYETRVLVFRLKIPHRFRFGPQRIPLNVIYKFMLFKGTRKEFDECYDRWIKGREVEDCIETVTVLYRKQEHIDNCDGCVDRNYSSNRYAKDKKYREGVQRKAAYRYLKSSFR